MNVALHQRPTVIIFNPAMPPIFRHTKLLCETLFAEITHCIVISVGKKVLATVHFAGIVFCPVHEAGAETRNLEGLCNGAKSDFGKTLRVERTVGNTTDDCTVITNNDDASAGKRVCF